MILRRVFVFFFNDPAPPEFYTLSLHDALPISCCRHLRGCANPCVLRGDSRWPPRARTFEAWPCACDGWGRGRWRVRCCPRSEEHTSELQSHVNLVCRLLLEKKKTQDSDKLWTF